MSDQLLNDAIKEVKEVAFDQGTPGRYTELFTRAGLNPETTRATLKGEMEETIDKLVNLSLKPLPVAVLAFGANMFLTGIEYEKRRKQEGMGDA